MYIFTSSVLSASIVVLNYIYTTGNGRGIFTEHNWRARVNLLGVHLFITGLSNVDVSDFVENCSKVYKECMKLV